MPALTPDGGELFPASQIRTKIFPYGTQQILPRGKAKSRRSDSEDGWHVVPKGVDREIRLPVLLTTDVIASIHNQRKAFVPRSLGLAITLVQATWRRGMAFVVVYAWQSRIFYVWRIAPILFYLSGFSRSLRSLRMT